MFQLYLPIAEVSVDAFLILGIGGIVGFLGAIITMLALGQHVIGSGSELTQLAAMPEWGWAVLPILPILGMLLAMLVARTTVRRTLERSL